MGRLARAAILVVVLGIAFGVVTYSLNGSPRYAASREGFAPSYPYGSSAFDTFVADSYAYAKARNTRRFYTWMDSAYSKSSAKFPGKGNLSLTQLLDAKRRHFASIENPVLLTHNEIAFAAWMHRMVKTVIPKFSLDRGFEFTNTVSRGERQCFLQSVLITGMLQRAGVDAGVVMVSRNIAGEETNNGHAVALVRLPNGQDIIVDASDPTPFVRQQGLFTRQRGYDYVVPVYATGSSKIRFYRPEGGGAAIATSRIRTLDLSFIRSQFYYYRGERAPGGILADKPTPSGLKQSENQLKMSVSLSPQNPLAVYMLGRVYLLQGNENAARSTIRLACSLYGRFGWIPSGPKEYLALVNRSSTSARLH